jgi:hypothetical protein
MRTLAVFSNKKNAEMAAEELIEKAEASLDFNPDLVLFYATLKYNGHYQEMLDIFRKCFGDIPQIGASVDGMIFPHDMRTDGAVLVFPLVHVPDAIKSAEFYAKGKYFSFRANKGDEKTKIEMARRFSDYCDKGKIFYLPPTVLEIFAKQFDYKVPVVGMNLLHTRMNLLHTRVKFNSPSIFSNFKDIGDGIAALVIEKDDIEVVYDDIFPDKGATMEETMGIVEDKFKVIEEFDALFEKNILISLNSKSPVKAVKDVTRAFEKDEMELKEEFNKGNFQVQVPYFILFFNKKLKTIQTLGISSYFPFDLFPFFFDTNDLSNKVYLTHEPIFLRLNDYISSLYSLEKTKNFVLFNIDVGSISAFGNKVLFFKDEVEKIASENYFGIISESPSIFIPKKYQKRNYITGSEEDIFFAANGTNIFSTI